MTTLTTMTNMPVATATDRGMNLPGLRLVVNKVTRRCNIACSYCSSNSAPNIKSPDMDLSTFRRAVDVLLPATHQKRVMWLFHGGEPLILGLPWFRAAMNHLMSVAERLDVHIDPGIQTNGTLLNEEWIQFVRNNNTAISTSLDGPPDINDRGRALSSKVVDAIRLMVANSVQPRVVALVTQHNWNRMDEVLDFFEDLGVRLLKFNPCYQIGRGALRDAVSGEQFFQAKLAILRRMTESNNWGFTDINLVNQLLRHFRWYMRSDTPSCCTIRCAAGWAYIEVASDGTLYPCGRAEDAGCVDAMGHVDRMIVAKSLADCISRFHASVGPHGECLDCPASSLCDFGCPSYERANPSNFKLDCTFNKLMYGYVSSLNKDEQDQLCALLLKLRQRIPAQYAK
jgi:uncharacterized protein